MTHRHEDCTIIATDLASVNLIAVTCSCIAAAWYDRKAKVLTVDFVGPTAGTWQYDGVSNSEAKDIETAAA